MFESEIISGYHSGCCNGKLRQDSREANVIINEPPAKNLPEPKKLGIDEINLKEYKSDPMFTPRSREVVIVYFKEMPPSLEKFVAKYGGKLIFAKEE